jgi:hypothetical protein
VDSPLVVTTYHFPGSVGGAGMATNVLDAMSGRLEVQGRGPFDTVTYPLQQTACPAIVVAAPSIGTLEEELRLAESWYQREQAYAIFLGVLSHYGVADSGQVLVELVERDPTFTAVDSIAEGRILSGGAGAAGWRVTVEGTWTLVTGDDGVVLFDKIPAGEYRISAVKSGRLFGDVVRLAPGGRAVVRFHPEDGQRNRP